MGLSEAQRTEIIQLRRLFLTKMGNITKQRREIHETMMVCLQPLFCTSVVGAVLAKPAPVNAIPSMTCVLPLLLRSLAAHAGLGSCTSPLASSPTVAGS